MCAKSYMRLEMLGSIFVAFHSRNLKMWNFTHVTFFASRSICKSFWLYEFLGSSNQVYHYFCCSNCPFPHLPVFIHHFFTYLIAFMTALEDLNVPPVKWLKPFWESKEQATYMCNVQVLSFCSLWWAANYSKYSKTLEYFILEQHKCFIPSFFTRPFPPDLKGVYIVLQKPGICNIQYPRMFIRCVL